MSESLSRALRAYLTNGDDLSTDARTTAARLCHLLTHLERAAAALVGFAGFRTLFARSLHLNRGKHPWCGPAIGDRCAGTAEADASLAALLERVARQEHRVATAAAVDLLITVTELLGTFIGEHLTTGLVKQAWSDVLADSPPREFSA